MGRMLADRLAEEADITEFFLLRNLNHFCLGCYSCIEDEAKCPFWSEKKIILDALEQADLFIITKPNYCLAPSGVMKSLLDLLFDCCLTAGWCTVPRNGCSQSVPSYFPPRQALPAEKPCSRLRTPVSTGVCPI